LAAQPQPAIHVSGQNLPGLHEVWFIQKLQPGNMEDLWRLVLSGYQFNIRELITRNAFE